MRSTSNILSELARGIGLSNPEGDMTDLQIPATFQPFLEPVAPLDAAIPTVSTDVQRGSWGISFSLIQPASTAAVVIDIATLGRGLWDIDVAMQLSGNFISTVAIADGTVRLSFPNGSALQIIGLDSSTLAVAFLRRRIRVLIANDGTLVQVRQGVTGVGETHKITASVYCAKML